MQIKIISNTLKTTSFTKKTLSALLAIVSLGLSAVFFSCTPIVDSLTTQTIFSNKPTDNTFEFEIGIIAPDITLSATQQTELLNTFKEAYTQIERFLGSPQFTGKIIINITNTENGDYNDKNNTITIGLPAIQNKITLYHELVHAFFDASNTQPTLYINTQGWLKWPINEGLAECITTLMTFYPGFSSPELSAQFKNSFTRNLFVENIENLNKSDYLSNYPEIQTILSIATPLRYMQSRVTMEKLLVDNPFFIQEFNEGLYLFSQADPQKEFITETDIQNIIIQYTQTKFVEGITIADWLQQQSIFRTTPAGIRTYSETTLSTFNYYAALFDESSPLGNTSLTKSYEVIINGKNNGTQFMNNGCLSIDLSSYTYKASILIELIAATGETETFQVIKGTRVNPDNIQDIPADRIADQVQGFYGTTANNITGYIFIQRIKKFAIGIQQEANITKAPFLNHSYYQSNIDQGITLLVTNGCYSMSKLLPVGQYQVSFTNATGNTQKKTINIGPSTPTYQLDF